MNLYSTPILQVLLPLGAALASALGLVVAIRDKRHFFGFLTAFAFTITSIVSLDLFTNTRSIPQLCYAFLVPLTLLLGPSLLMHVKSISGLRKPNDLLHFIPAGIILIDHLAFSLINNNATSLGTTLHDQILTVPISYMFSPIFSYISLGVSTGSYAVWTLVFMNKHPETNYKGLYGVVIQKIVISPVILVAILTLLFEQTQFNIPIQVLIVLLSLTCIPLVVHFFKLLKRSLPEEIKTVEPMNPGQQQPQDLMRIENYINTLEKDATSVLLNEDVNKLDFIKTTPFSLEQWENYFQVTGHGYVDLKKRVRVAVALTLIKDGFLNTYSVDALSKEIGYKSRTSFYSCFEEVTGSKFPEFRDSLKKSNSDEVDS